MSCVRATTAVCYCNLQTVINKRHDISGLSSDYDWLVGEMQADVMLRRTAARHRKV
jgi:hypothetical protein